MMAIDGEALDVSIEQTKFAIRCVDEWKALYDTARAKQLSAEESLLMAEKMIKQMAKELEDLKRLIREQNFDNVNG